MTAEFINVRYKLGMLDLDDVQQTVRMDVNCYFYYMPDEDIRPNFKFSGKVRFENIDQPEWLPNFDFNDECEKALQTDKSFWLDLETGRVFGRLNFIPHIQQRFDHHAFPFDRQIVEVSASCNNCLIKRWTLKTGEYPPELSLSEEAFIVEAELNATADSWDLIAVKAFADNDQENKSTTANFLIFIEREVDFYFWNIVMVFFIIIFLKVVLIAFPYNESRFDFAMVLALTTVAFKFVSAEMVPKTSYTTVLDKYMLFGMFLLAFRFLLDFGIQFGLEDILPFGQDGIRRKCGEDERDVCDVDMVFTIALAAIWTAALVAFAACSFVTSFKNLIRPGWEKLTVSALKGDADNNDPKSLTGHEVMGTSEWKLRTDKITKADMKDMVDYSKTLARDMKNLDDDYAAAGRTSLNVFKPLLNRSGFLGLGLGGGNKSGNLQPKSKHESSHHDDHDDPL